MPIILPLGRTVKVYLHRYGKCGPEFAVVCPHCGGQTHKHGRYWRTAVTGRQVYRIPIYRWRCTGCRRTTAVLPDFLVPYAQFVSLVRERVLRRRLRDWPVAKIAARACRSVAGGLSERTVFRWLAKVRELATGWTQVLSEVLLLVRPGADLFSRGSRWQGKDGLLRSLCDVGGLCRHYAPSKQSHPGLYAYCSGLAAGLPRL